MGEYSLGFLLLRHAVRHVNASNCSWQSLPIGLPYSDGGEAIVVVAAGERSTLLLVLLPCFHEGEDEEVSEVRLKTLRIRFRKGMFCK